MIASTLFAGHELLADVLLLVAAVLFVVEVAVRWTTSTTLSRGVLLAAGLACVAVALLVL